MKNRKDKKVVVVGAVETAEKSTNFKKVATSGLVAKLRQNKVNTTEKQEIIGILQKRGAAEVAEFIPKRRGRKPIEGRPGAEEFPRDTVVTFEKYRKPGEFITGVVTANSNPYTNKAGEVNYLLTIREDQVVGGKVKAVYYSKNSKSVQKVK